VRCRLQYARQTARPRCRVGLLLPRCHPRGASACAAMGAMARSHETHSGCPQARPRPGGRCACSERCVREAFLEARPGGRRPGRLDCWVRRLDCGRFRVAQVHSRGLRAPGPWKVHVRLTVTLTAVCCSCYVSTVHPADCILLYCAYYI
jgi:hypothetical protein